MKSLNLYILSFIILFQLSNAINCDDIKNLLNIEYEGECCDLQQVVCDEAREKILNINFEYGVNHLLRRKGGGRRPGGARPKPKPGASDYIDEEACANWEQMSLEEYDEKCYKPMREGQAKDLGYESFQDLIEKTGGDDYTFEAYKKKHGLDKDDSSSKPSYDSHYDSHYDSSNSGSSQSDSSYSKEYEERLRKGEISYYDDYIKNKGNNSSSTSSSSYDSTHPSSYNYNSTYSGMPTHSSLNQIPTPTSTPTPTQNPSDIDISSGISPIHKFNLFIWIVVILAVIKML